MNLLKKLPIAIQFAALLIAGLAVALGTAYLVGRAVYVGEVRSQARTVADMVDNVGRWATQYRGLWVKGDPKNANFKVGSFLEQESTAAPPDPLLAMTRPDLMPPAFHRKNPALVQRELSDITAASAAKAKFRMTSDKYMNPDNAPTRFDVVAMDHFRRNPADEYSEITGGKLLFARRLVAEKGCLSCHGTPVAAPEAVRALYPGPQGYGYEEGKLAGVISIAIPLEYDAASFMRRLDGQVWVAISAGALALALLLVIVHRNLVVPLRQIREFATAAAASPLGNSVVAVTLADDEQDSANELHQLNVAVKALHASVDYLYRRGAGRQ